MDPLSQMLMMGGGLVAQTIGGIMNYGAQKDYNQAQVQTIGLEKQVNQQHREAMELTSRRDMLQNLRHTQIARATALTNATSQGASYGSGLQGGYSEISGQGNTNEAGVTQNLQIGRNIFGLDDQINQQKINMANASQSMQTAQGISSFGTSLFGASKAFGSLTSGNRAPSNPFNQTGSLY